MNYYFWIENNNIDGVSELYQPNVFTEDRFQVEVTKEMYDAYEKDKYIYQNDKVIPNPNWEEIQKQKRRQELDNLTLTSTDVERALYKAKKWNFDDLKTYIGERMPNLDLKAVGIEFRAKDFWRGAPLEIETEEGTTTIRLIDTIGALLGYTSEDMDYLFEHKQLPVKEDEE